MLQVQGLERHLAAAARVLHQSLQAKDGSSTVADACAARAEGCEAVEQQQQQAAAAETALTTSEATLVRLDATLAAEKRALHAATEARDAAQQEVAQAERRYQRCTAVQGQQGPRPKPPASGASADVPSHGARRQLRVTPDV